MAKPFLCLARWNVERLTPAALQMLSIESPQSRAQRSTAFGVRSVVLMAEMIFAFLQSVKCRSDRPSAALTMALTRRGHAGIADSPQQHIHTDPAPIHYHPEEGDEAEIDLRHDASPPQ